MEVESLEIIIESNEHEVEISNKETADQNI